LKRIKRRYLALRVEVDGVPSEREIADSIWGSVSRLFGEVGASLTGLVLIDFNVERKVAVIRVSLVSLSMVRASLAAITSVGGREASVHVLGVSGTLKALFHNVG
jgi:ribonuclease P/MRP protein subunit POP5